MPHVKYRGGQPPISVKDSLAFEDPTAPCHQGLSEALAKARRFAETSSSDATAQAIAIREYLTTNPYIGLEHIGGIGFVEDNAVRPVDEPISAEEYKELRTEIETANDNYRKRKAEELEKSNDPLRRANPEHDALGWRTRVEIISYTELEHHVPYPVGDGSFAYTRMRKNWPEGRTTQLIDIYHAFDGDIEIAHLAGIDRAEKLVDLLALAGYGAAYLAKILSTTVPYSTIAREFPLATSTASVFNTPIPVTPGDLTGGRFDKTGRLVLRNLRDGLSASIPTVAFASFWNALERQAEEQARASNLQRLVKCDICGSPRPAGWNLKQPFETMYSDAGIDPSAFDRHRSKRGSIQHGAKLPTTEYLKDVLEDLGQVQATATVAVAKKVGIAPGATVSLSTSWPVAIFSCIPRDDQQVEISFKRLTMGAGAGKLPQNKCGGSGRTIQAGVSLPPRVDPLALPPLQKE